jgi:predicted DNA-binding transcriptional regulator AlpA
MTAMPFDDSMLSKRSVAALLGCSPRTVERRVRAKEFPPPLQFGKDGMWFESVVDKWLHARREEQLSWEACPRSTTPAAAAPAKVSTPSGRKRRSATRDEVGKQAKSFFDED